MNYLPTTNPGTTRRRAKFVELINQAGGEPYIRWHEEDQIHMADGTYRFVPTGTLDTAVTPESLTESFPMVHPDTGEPIGLMTGQHLHLAIQSYYVHLAKQRDEKNVNQGLTATNV